MKRIALFCDGTWNTADARYKTNVFKLCQQVPAIAPDEIEQRAFYFEGVGTGRGPNWLARKIDRLGGGAFGWGLLANVEQAYQALAQCYETGDEVYIFGFSRGAYTARSLAGLIRASSIPADPDPMRIYHAARRYKSGKSTTKPNSPQSFAYRHEMNPALVTQAEENDWRRDNGLAQGLILKTTYLGIWDTVGALGVPNVLGPISYLWNLRYRFHDTMLSHSVRAARHAVAVDEKRRTFAPTLWKNLAVLNGETTGTGRPYREVWFAGDHGSVGGGGDITGLSDAALAWIGQGAVDMDLAFETTTLADHRASADALAPLVNQSKPRQGLGAKLARQLKKHRVGPARFDDVAEPTANRWRDATPAYRPRPLGRVASQMQPPG